jgi:hypothetical protein
MSLNCGEHSAKQNSIPGEFSPYRQISNYIQLRVADQPASNGDTKLASRIIITGVIHLFNIYSESFRMTNFVKSVV